MAQNNYSELAVDEALRWMVNGGSVHALIHDEDEWYPCTLRINRWYDLVATYSQPMRSLSFPFPELALNDDSVLIDFSIEE